MKKTRKKKKYVRTVLVDFFPPFFDTPPIRFSVFVNLPLFYPLILSSNQPFFTRVNIGGIRGEYRGNLLCFGVNLQS